MASTEQIPEEVEQDTGITSQLLNMGDVPIRDLATFTHPRLAKAQEQLYNIISSGQVAAGFGSAL